MLAHLHASLFIKREIKEKSQCNLEQKLIIAWYKTVKFLNHALLFHFCLIVSENW